MTVRDKGKTFSARFRGKRRKYTKEERAAVGDFLCFRLLAATDRLGRLVSVARTYRDAKVIGEMAYVKAEITALNQMIASIGSLRPPTAEEMTDAITQVG